MAFDSFTIKTSKRVCLVNITSRAQEHVSQIGMRDGLCIVFIPHTTAGITINEAADPAVAHDIEKMLAELIPSNGHFTHSEGNSDAHIKASLMGSSVTIPISNGRLALGTWQGIFLCEFDGPRQRSVYIQAIG